MTEIDRSRGSDSHQAGRTVFNEDGIYCGEMTRPDPELIRRLGVFRPASVVGTLGPSAVLCPGSLLPLAPEMRVVGPAVTVRVDHVDHLTALTAATLAEPGDVLVISVGGPPGIAVWGHGLGLAAEASGVAGIVIDGAVVNKAELLEMTLPVFARGVSPITGSWDGHGRINVPIAIDGRIVQPGEVILGDGDGVVAIPVDRLEAVVEVAEGFEGENARRRQLMAEGIPLLDLVRQGRQAS